MTRPLPILLALAVSSPALLAVVQGGLGVDTALLRLMLALVVCGVVDSLVRAWWPEPLAPDEVDPGAPGAVVPAQGAPGAGTVSPAGADRRTRRGRAPSGPIHARRTSDLPAP